MARHGPVALPRMNDFRIGYTVTTGGCVKKVEQVLDGNRRGSTVVSVEDRSEEIIDVLLKSALSTP